MTVLMNILIILNSVSCLFRRFLFLIFSIILFGCTTWPEYADVTSTSGSQLYTNSRNIYFENYSLFGNDDIG